MRIEAATADKILDIIYNRDYAFASSSEVAQALHMQPEETENIFFGLETAIPALIQADKTEDGCYIRINTDHYLQFWGFIDTGGFQQHPELLKQATVAVKYKTGITLFIIILALILLCIIAAMNGWL